MTTQQVSSVFQTFTDLTGNPLENGYIYIGLTGKNPIEISNQIPVFYDRELITPVAQPIRTVAGYPSRSGSPARLYTNSKYSIVVQDSKEELMYAALTPLLPVTEDDLPWFDILNYGDGSFTEETWVAAITALGSVDPYTLLVEDGTWEMNGSINIPSNVRLQFKSGANLNISNGVLINYDGPDIFTPNQKIFTITGTGNFIFNGDVKHLLPQWWGAIGDGVVDCTTAIQAAIDSAKESRAPVYITMGVYLLTEALVVRNVAGVNYGGFMIYGDGFRSVLYQTGAGKNGLEMGRPISVNSPILEGITLRDFSIVGTNGTNYGLFLEEVARSFFSNIQISSDEADLAVKGCLLNAWNGIKLSFAAFNENPIPGVILPTTRKYGLFTLSGSANSYTTNAFNGLVVEGHSVGGMFIEGGSTNSYHNLTIEGQTGYGLLSSSEWDVFNGIYCEAITEFALKFLNSQKVTVNGLFTNTETVELTNTTVTFTDCRCELIINEPCAFSTFTNCDGTITYTGETAGTNFNFVNCGFKDLTNYITYRNGDLVSGTITNTFSAESPRPLKDGILYDVNPPQDLLSHDGDKFYFSEGNIIGNLGPRTGGYLGCVCINRKDTELSAPILAGATTLPVLSTAGIEVGDKVAVEISITSAIQDFDLEWSVVTAIIAGPALTIDTPITSAAVISSKVITNRWSLFGQITGFQPLDLNTVTPTVRGGRDFNTVTVGLGSITNLDDGWVGQEVRFFPNHGPVTVTNGVNIFLNGGVDFVMGVNDSLTLILKSDNKWYEVSRSEN